jgi:hypothetical protein
MRSHGHVLTLAMAALLLASTPQADAAVSDPAAVPVILSPAADARLSGDFAGPVVIDFAPVEVAEDYVVSARLEGDCDPADDLHPCAVDVTVPVAADTGQVEVVFPRALEHDGSYRLEVGARSGGLVTTSRFLLVGTSGGAPAQPSASVRRPTGHVASGFNGPVVVDLRRTDYAHQYVIALRDHGRDVWSTTLTSTGGSFSWIVPTLTAPGRYHVVVEDAQGQNVYADQAFTVDPRPLMLSGVDASPAKFFPRVRDGYRDSVTISFRLNDVAGVQWSVRDAAGHRVRAEPGRTRPEGDGHVRWNGRDDSGRRVPKGTYTVKLRGLTEDGRKDVARVEVRVATKKVWHSETASFDGRETTDRARSRSCYFRSLFGELTLDCWGGRFAEVTYAFRVPRTATHVSWRVRGEVNCCDDGRITKDARRVSDRRVVISVRVTNWRSYTARRASIEYDWYTRL